MSADPNVKLIKAILFNAAATMAAAVLRNVAAGPGAVGAAPTLDANVSTPTTQQEDIEMTQLHEVHYYFLLQALNMSPAQPAAGAAPTQTYYDPILPEPAATPGTGGAAAKTPAVNSSASALIAQAVTAASALSSNPAASPYVGALTTIITQLAALVEPATPTAATAAAATAAAQAAATAAGS